MQLYAPHQLLDQQKQREIRTAQHTRNREVKDLDQEVRKCVDGLLNEGCTLQQTRELLTHEIDCRLRFSIENQSWSSTVLRIYLFNFFRLE